MAEERRLMEEEVEHHPEVWELLHSVAEEAEQQHCLSSVARSSQDLSRRDSRLLRSSVAWVYRLLGFRLTAVLTLWAVPRYFHCRHRCYSFLC